MITHIVIFWTDKPYGSNRDRLLAGAKKLGEIPGAVGFRCGTALPSKRSVVDDSFAVGITMSFKTQEEADVYQAHPIHTDFVENCLKPLSRRFVVYDIVD